jgi:hypothetical protein
MLPCEAIQAQLKGRLPPNRQAPTRLTTQEAADWWRAFLDAQPVAPFAVDIEIEERPRRGPSLRAEATVYADWLSSPQRTRLEAVSASSGFLAYLWLSDESPAAWRVSGAADVWRALDPADWNQPMVPGFSLSVFDLCMPFLRWQHVAYEGAERFLGRPVFRYRLAPQAGAALAGVHAVELLIDADFRAILRMRAFDAAGELMRAWAVSSIQRVDDGWTVRALDFSDPVSRAKSRVVFKSWYQFMDTNAAWWDSLAPAFPLQTVRNSILQPLE